MMDNHDEAIVKYLTQGFEFLDDGEKAIVKDLMIDSKIKLTDYLAGQFYNQLRELVSQNFEIVRDDNVDSIRVVFSYPHEYNADGVFIPIETVFDSIILRLKNEIQYLVSIGKHTTTMYHSPNVYIRRFDAPEAFAYYFVLTLETVFKQNE